MIDPDQSGETRTVLRGIAASPGVAVGPVTVFDRGHVYVPRRKLLRDACQAEISRLRRAIEASRRELEEIRERLEPGPGAEQHRLILDAHLLMHRDELLVDGAAQAIARDAINAEWAVRNTVDAIKKRFEDASERYFRERAGDIEQVGERILRRLTNTLAPLPLLEGPTVLVAADLGPADLAELVRSSIRAIVTDLGSATSHTAILARTLEIPAVVGITEVTRLVGNGDVVVVDGLRGEVILDPDEQERERAEARAERYTAFTGRLRARRGAACATRDGTRIVLDANVELPAEAALSVEEGADGIGLYRTEFLYLDRPEPPDEEEQARVYSDVVKVLAPRHVVFRTFDLGGDKLPTEHRLPRGPNPALGLRAIRLSLARPELFVIQVRAILRAAVHGPVRLMLPLIASLGELRQARALVERARIDLERAGVDHRPVPLGIMVEVPSAAIMADTLAGECEFFSVGTNDLVQYTLAIDRTNPRVAYLARPLDPAVLRLLDSTARAANSRELPLSMCGDMASDPVAIPIVVGLGYRELSVPVAMLALTREVLGRIRIDEARAAAQEALSCATAADVERLVMTRFKGALGDVWDEHGIDA